MNLELFLKENNVWHKFLEKPETIHTADAANQTGIDLKCITKSLILLDDKKNPILAILPGDSKLSFQKLRTTLNTSKVFLVPFNDAEKYSGYLPGAIPMVHHKEKMQTVLDSKLMKFETIYGGGGERIKLLELKSIDVKEINKAIVADITE